MKPFFLSLFALLILAVPTLAQDDAPAMTTYRPEILAVRPHDPAAFTQGFILYDGLIYESTGRRGESTLRVVDPETGDVGRMISIDEQYFAEGLARVDDRLIQLTWQAQTAFLYDLETFDLLDTFSYETEGWGLCYDEQQLYMTDGSPDIFIRDAQTFELLDQYTVTIQGQSIRDGLLNELECVGDDLYANLWQTDFIVRIDKTNGAVTGLINAAGLLTPPQAPNTSMPNTLFFNSQTERIETCGPDNPASPATCPPFDTVREVVSQCTDGAQLYTSSNDSVITVQPSDEGAITYALIPNFGGYPVGPVAEIACSGDDLFVSVVDTPFILRIDKNSGVILDYTYDDPTACESSGEAEGLAAIYEAGTCLRMDAAIVTQANVLNGIAYDPESDTFWLTGKLWPLMFEVRWVEVEN